MPDAFRPRISHRATKTELEAQANEGFGLLNAAIEGMRDTAAWTVIAQLLEHRVLRTAHMQQYGQIKIARQFKLLDVKPLHPRAVQSLDIEIQANLPHRNGAASFKPGAHGIERIILLRIDIHRMNAKRWRHIMVCRSQAVERRKIRGCNRRYDKNMHARIAGVLHHNIAVFFKLARIQMDMRVDQHRFNP